MKTFNNYLIQGFFIVVPIALVAFLVAKIITFLKVLVNPISTKLFPEYHFGADLVSNIILAVIFLLVCLILGFFANRPFLKKVVVFLEGSILSKIPGYTFFKGLTHNIQSSTQSPESFQPVLVSFDDNAQLGFQIDHLDSGDVVVYLPGAPNPWSGSIVYTKPERIKKLNVTVAQAVKHLKELGKYSNTLNLTSQK